MNAEIYALEQAAMERWRNGDPWAWEELAADDIIYIDPGLAQPILGKEAYHAYLAGIAGKIFYQGSEFISPRIEMVGEAAVFSYNYRSTVLDAAGKAVEVTPWNATEVFTRCEGNWRIVHTHWSFTQHHLPAALEIPLPVQLQPAGYTGLLGELMALETAAMDRWRKGDPDGFLELSAPEVTYFDTATSRRLNGRDALATVYARLRGTISYDAMDFVAPQVRVCGDLALLTYRFLSTFLNADGTVQKRTPWNCSEVFRRGSDGWKILHTHWSFIHGER